MPAHPSNIARPHQPKGHPEAAQAGATPSGFAVFTEEFAEVMVDCPGELVGGNLADLAELRGGDHQVDNPFLPGAATEGATVAVRLEFSDDQKPAEIILAMGSDKHRELQKLVAGLAAGAVVEHQLPPVFTSDPDDRDPTTLTITVLGVAPAG